MGNRFDIRQQISDAPPDDRAPVAASAERSVAVTSPPLSPVTTHTSGAAACVQHTGKLAACQCQQQRIRAVLLQRGMLFILRLCPAKRRRTACLFTFAPCSTSSRRSISHASCACKTLSAGAPYRQAPSADEPPSPKTLLTQRLLPAQCTAVIAHD